MTSRQRILLILLVPLVGIMLVPVFGGIGTREMTIWVVLMAVWAIAFLTWGRGGRKDSPHTT